MKLEGQMEFWKTHHFSNNI